MSRFRFTRSFFSYFAALLMVGAAPLVPATPAAAEGERTVTLDPATGLAPGQEVALTGAGFNPSVSVAVVQCRGAVPTVGDCDIGNFATVTSDASGGFSATFVIRRLLSRGSSIVDCASVPGACVLVGVEMSDFSLHAVAPLEFDPDAPFPPSPSLVVTPSIDLVDKQIVEVGGSGFVPDHYYSLRQCVAGPAPEIPCAPTYGDAYTDESGVLTGSIPVRRIIDGSVDCASAPDACEMLAFSSSPDLASRAPLDFDPDGPLPVPPVVTVDPSTGLADRQEVTVSGSSFMPDTWVDLSVCEIVDGAPAYPCRWYDTEIFTDGSGAFTTSLPIRRLIRSYDDTALDCAVVSCALVARTYTGFEEQASAPVAFDPAIPLPPPPTFSVDPSTGLADRQIVDVSGGGWTPGTWVSLRQCAVAEGQTQCSYGNWRDVRVEADGSISGAFRVRRQISWWEWDEETATGAEQTVDCATEPEVCVIEAANYEDGAELSVPLTFDPDAPPAALPAMEVSPSAGLVDRQEVDLYGTGFLPGESLYLSQCGAPEVEGDMPSPCRGGVSISADDDGAIAATVVVRRMVGGYGSAPVDCAASDGRCVIQAGYWYGGDHGFVPLSFDPNGPMPVRPDVRAAPEVGLTDGQVVEVHGTGFSPHASVALAQCRSDANSTGGCDIFRFKYVTASSSGEFATTFEVRSMLDAGGTTVDCAAEPGLCGVGAGNSADFTEGKVAPITFGDPPVVSVGDAGAAEGDEGTATVDVPLTLSGPSHAPVSVHYELVAGSAQPGDDFVAASGEAAFAPGETTTTVPVELVGDVTDENDETFQVVLSDPRHATVGGDAGVVTIVDDDAPPVIVPMAGMVDEGHSKRGRFVEIPVVLTAPSGKVVTAEYRTVRFTAKKDTDFRNARGVLTFAPGQTSAVVRVEIVGDRKKEPTELFLVPFSKPTNATLGGFSGYGFGVILDDD